MLYKGTEKERDEFFGFLKQDGKIFILHANPECEKLLGGELTEHTGDTEYEYWRLVRSYAETILLDMRENKGRRKTKSKSNKG